ncbi:MAG: helix-turn-helix transcriptional regulator [Tannerellaceae bacterium]|nr:helix-turn-helix transcriptional regulator [Tannerellaceae bacterium]
MKKQFRPVHLVISFVFIFLQPVVSAVHTDIPDSLLTKDHVYEYTFSDPEKAHRIVDLMRKRKSAPEFKLDIIEGDLYFNNRKASEALVFYTRALNSDSVRNDAYEYMQQLHRMISCYDALHDVSNKTLYVKRLLDKAEETGNREMKSVALFSMGKMIYDEEDKLRGYQLIKEAIEEMTLSDYKYKYDNLRYNYNTLLRMQQRDGYFEEALETLDALESVVTAATSEEPHIAGLDEKEIKTMFAWRANILSFLDRMEEAGEAYRQWQSIGREYTQDDYLITTYLLRAKCFDEVIDIYIPQERFYIEQKDTINYHMKTIKRLMGKAFEGKGDYVGATRCYRELAILTDSLKAREQRSAAVELAVVYETHEKERKLEEQAVHLKIRNIFLLSAGIVIFFLIIILWRNIKHARTIRIKNKTMALTIEELLVHKENLFEIKEELKVLKEKQTESEQTELQNRYSSGDHPETDRVKEENNENRILFETLDNRVIREKLYLNPDLSREDLMKLIRVNKNHFGSLLHQYTGTNATTYINNKRLEHAARLLKTHPDYTIAAIAELSGIPNIPTFNRLFKAKFGMTPTEFKGVL